MIRWGVLVKLALWAAAAAATAWSLPSPPPEDLLDPAGLPDRDATSDDRSTLLAYLLARLALWILFALFFGTPPDDSAAAGCFFLFCRLFPAVVPARCVVLPTRPVLVDRPEGPPRLGPLSFPVLVSSYF